MPKQEKKKTLGYIAVDSRGKGLVWVQDDGTHPPRFAHGGAITMFTDLLELQAKIEQSEESYASKETRV